MKNMFYIVLVLLIVSCQKKINDSNTKNVDSKMIVNYDQNIITDFAKIVAVAQNRASFRQLLLNESLIDVGMENTIFYFVIKDKSINIDGVNTGISDYFHFLSDSLDLNYDLPFFESGVVSTIPKLSISIHLYDSDVSEFEYSSTLKVLDVTEDAYGLDEVILNAYDANLDVYSFSSFVEPDENIVIVEDNPSYSLIDISSNLTENGISIYDRLLMKYCGGVETYLDSLSNNPNDSILILMNSYGFTNKAIVSHNHIFDKFNNSCDDNYLIPDPPPVPVCDRDSIEARERLTKVKVQHDELKKFSKWWRKWTTIKVVQVYVKIDNGVASNITAPDKFVHTKRKYLKHNKEHEMDGMYFINWKYLTGEHGDTYTMNFIGLNPKAGDVQEIILSSSNSTTYKTSNGQTQTVTVSGSIKSSVHEKDSNLGGDIISYCDPFGSYWTGTEYNTGLIKFWIKESN
jgi:hypothetical protein